MSVVQEKVGSVLVVGGGVAGIQSALDLAESGFFVYLAEKGPSVGGVMSQLDKTFPTNDCAMCILSPKMVEVARHPNIRLLTLAELKALRGEAGHFEAVVAQRPRYVDLAKCTGCGQCVEKCLVQNEPYFDQRSAAADELDADEAARVEAILQRYEGVGGAEMPVLQDIAQAWGYLPEPVLRHAADRLHVALSHLYRLATFYESFSLVPRGRHIISICTGTACHIRGAGRLLDFFASELHLAPGETTSDRRFTLEEVRCLGCCSLAPVLKIGNAVFGDVKPTMMEKILAKYE
ncbi:MAG: NAD(P)H-dependent oxidoreductase subunit E [Candidatus Sumerlaeia bacterium]|nr:NAD(P)H-dependent oxidoreductase subunit E [Candidatus Sumerlaeia bacterium]